MVLEQVTEDKLIGQGKPSSIVVRCIIYTVCLECRLVSERRSRHRELYNKGKLKREFYTRDLVLVRKYIKSIRKDGIEHKLEIQNKTTP